MSGSAQLNMGGNNNTLCDIAELRRLIMVCNQKVVREKFEQYSLDFQKSDEEISQVKIHVIHDKRATATSSEESANSFEVPEKVENVYKTKLLREFRKRKTFLKEVNIN
jgi:hypothetical protein